MIQELVKIENELGLHARAAAKFVRLASQFQSNIFLTRQQRDERIDGKSILGILLLAAAKGTELTITVDGSDEQEALRCIVELIRDKFGECK